MLLDADGKVLGEERRLSPHAGVDALVATAARIVEELAPSRRPGGCRRRRARRPRRPRALLAEPARRFATRRCARRCDAATKHPVVVDNDANVAARGEVAYGAAEGVQHALLVTLGTGIGGAMLLDGELYRGAHGFGAEIGHMTVERDGPLCACGERGHWEAIASGTALGRMARELVAAGRRRARSSRRPGGARARGHRRARRGGRARGRRRRHRAAGAATPTTSRSGSPALANVLDPEMIVIAGRARGARPVVVRSAARVVHAPRRRRGVPAERSRSCPRSSASAPGAVGAAVLARELLRVSVRVGLTLPSFVEDPEIPIAVARAAEAAGLDAVFVFDHLWRGDPPNRRPALECFALLGAVAAETSPHPRRHAGRARDAAAARDARELRS